MQEEIKKIETDTTQQTKSAGASNMPLVEGEDFYMEGGYFVFTEKYHLQRGYCCKNGCRHCPYKKKKNA